LRRTNVAGSSKSLVSVVGDLFALGLTDHDNKDFAKFLESTAYFLTKGIKPEGQLLQDLWVVSQHGTKPGFFLDIGAGHPIQISNTWVLQSQFDWSGIVVEPNPDFSILHEQIRKSEKVQTLKLAVTPTRQPHMRYQNDGEYSGNPDNFPGELHHARSLHRSELSIDLVPAITVREILDARNISQIDYLNIDIEGGEVEILKSFPFDYCRVGLITVEHNYRHSDIKAVDDFLTEMNFRKCFNNSTEWDSFYISNELFPLSA
jgi:FkbM family methyltransferase